MKKRIIDEVKALCVGTDIIVTHCQIHRCGVHVSVSAANGHDTVFNEFILRRSKILPILAEAAEAVRILRYLTPTQLTEYHSAKYRR